MIRTNIEFAQIGSSVKSIAVTSSISMEGKSTTTVNLAYTYAQTGKKVLIVDADLRKPTLHKTFKLNNNVGLTTALVNDEYSLESVIQYSEDFDLYILPSGHIPPNPAEFVGLENPLKRQNRGFDYYEEGSFRSYSCKTSYYGISYTLFRMV